MADTTSFETDKEPRPPRVSTGRRAVFSLRTLRSLIALVVLLAWVLMPDHRPGVVVGFGVALVALSGLELSASFRLRRVGRPAAVIRSLAPASGGLVLLLGPADDLTRLAPAAGALLLVRGIGDAIAAITIGGRTRLRPWLVGLSVAEGTAGLAALLLTDLFGQAALVTLGFSWLAGGVLDGLAPAPPRARGVTLAPLPRRGPMPEVERARIAEEVYFDGPDTQERLVRFVVLLTIATVIATYGVLSNSVAAVIGGMIVAPLMGPIQALTAGLVAGATRRALLAALVLVSGMGLVLVLSMLIAATSRDLSATLVNEQVVGRTSPTLSDLAIALAAGAAAGFALVRRDVAGSLPGVAIAVSLVPPLCVSGASLAGGETRASLGAFLLFAINFAAIVVASGAVLLLAGFGAVEGRASNRLLTLSAAVGVALVAMTVPLATTGLDIIRQEALDTAVRAQLTDWLKPIQPAEVLDLRIDHDQVTVLLASVEHPPAPTTFEQAVADSVGHHVTVKIHWVQADSLG